MAIQEIRRLKCWVAVWAVAALGVSGSAPAVDVTLGWEPPTRTIEGEPLVDLAGFKVYWGAASRTYGSAIDVGVSTEITLGGFEHGATAYFSVTAYNSLGVESDFAEEVVWTAVDERPAEILCDPLDVCVTEPDAAVFAVSAGGASPVTFQWRRHGTAVANATNASYTLVATSVGADDGAEFSVVVSNPYGAATSAVARLTVEPPPVPAFIEEEPQDAAVTEPARVELSVTAGGDAPLAVQWRRNGEEIAGATGQRYVLDPSSAARDDGDRYDVVVRNPFGSATSRVATVRVAPSPAFSFRVLAPGTNTVARPGAGIEVEWCGSAALGLADIELWSGTNFVAALTNGVRAPRTNMVVQVALPCGLARGNDYWVAVMDAEHPEDYGLSDFFRIAARCPNDYNGDGRTDPTVYWRGGGMWYMSFGAEGWAEEKWGWKDTQAVPGDYDGDGMTDLAVYWQGGGMWYIRYSSGGTASHNWGWKDTEAVPGDYDGDGVTDLAVYWQGGGMWYLRHSGGGDAARKWGWKDAQAVPGDYDGDGMTDLAVYWQGGGMWYVDESGGSSYATKFGWSDACAVACR